MSPSAVPAAVQAMTLLSGERALLSPTRELFEALQAPASTSGIPENRAAENLARGFLDGLENSPLPAAPAAVFSDPLEPEWRAFLDSIRNGEAKSQGFLNPGAQACADAFLMGAIEAFPEAETKAFLKPLFRIWGKKMSPKDNPLRSPIPLERLSFSRDMGRFAGERLRADYAAALAGGLQKALVDLHLHQRDVDLYLAAKGWFLGGLEALRRSENGEAVAFLSSNAASIAGFAFHRGQVEYFREAIIRFPSSLSDLDRASNDLEAVHADAARSLRSNRNSVVCCTLRSGRFDYPARAAAALPGLFAFLDEEASRLEAADPDSAKTLRGNRFGIVGYTLFGGNLDYPREAAARLPGIFRYLDEEAAKMEPRFAQILKANRGTIAGYPLGHGENDYPAKAVRELPGLVEGLDRLIEATRSADPDTASILAANRASLVGRSLTRGDFKYPKEAARRLPEMRKALDQAIEASSAELNKILRENRTTILSRALGGGMLDYPQTLAAGLPGMVEVLDREIRSLRRSDAKAAQVLETNRASILYRVIANGDPAYPRRVAETLSRILETFETGIQSLLRTRPEAGLLVDRHQATVLNRMLTDGDLTYPERILKDVPKLLDDFDRAHRDLEAGDPEAAGVYARNRTNILHRAVSSGDMEYPRKAAGRLPALLRSPNPGQMAKRLHDGDLGDEDEAA